MHSFASPRFVCLRLVLALGLCWLCAGAAVADHLPTLADILNATQLDSRSGPMPSLRDVKTADILPGKPLAQAFRTGANVTRIERIALWIAGWNEAWTPEKSLALTLYDGANRAQALAQAVAPYSRRHWEGAVHLFYLDAPALPNHDYTFELTVRGGDGILRGVAVVESKVESRESKGEEGEGARKREGDPTPNAQHPTPSALWYEIHVKRAADRDLLFKQVFAHFNLDTPGMQAVKAAVVRKDWEAAKRALVSYFENSPEFPKEPATPKSDPRPVDANLIRDADLICEGRWRAVDEVVDLGPRWNHFAAWRTRGGVGLTRTGLRGILANAYRQTRNEKYARCWDAMLRCFFNDMPSPLRAGIIPPDARDISPVSEPGIGGGSMWASLSVGARMNHAFAYYAAFKDSPSFTRDTRFAFLANLAEMADVLEKMKGGGNWEAQNTTALFEFGQMFPEFKKARGWIERGFAGAAANCLENTYPDGPLKEATVNYHCLSLNRYLNVLEKAGKVGLTAPPEMRARVEKMLEYVMYATMPDGQLPQWGDSNPPSDARDLLARGAKLYRREDFRWIATQGREGRSPSKTSVAFPQAGWYIMRSGWDKDARFLMLHNGHSSAHGHADANSFVLTAYGAQMVVDPGIYIYGTKEAQELTATRSHSTVTPDGRDTVNDSGPVTFSTGELVDYYEGESAGYQGLKGAKHRRRVLRVHDGARRDFFLIADDATDAQPHDWTQTLRLGPGTVDAKQGASFFDWRSPGVYLSVLATGVEHAGQIETADTSPPTEERTSLQSAIAAAGWEKLARLPVLTLRQPHTITARFTLLLQPGRGRNRFAGRVIGYPNMASNGDRNFTMDYPDAWYSFVLTDGDTNRDSTGPGWLTCRAAACAAAAAPGLYEPPRWFAALDGRQARYGFSGKTLLFRSDTPSGLLEARRDGDTVRIRVDRPGRNLRVNPLGAQWLVVNGGERRPVPQGANLVAIP